MVLNSILFSFILFLISFVLGRRILRLLFFRYSAERESKISFSSLLEEFVFSTGVGLGIVSYLTLALALLGFLYKWVCLSLLIVLFCFTLYEIWKAKIFLHIKWQKLYTSFFVKKYTYFEYGLLIIVFMYTILSLLNVLAPPIDWDSLVYHLAIPKIWIQNHGVVYIPNIFQSEYHLTIQTLYTLGMVLTSDMSACFIIWLYSILFILAIFSFCRKYFSIEIGILALAAFSCTPLFSAITTRSMVDIPVGYYAFLGLYALFIHIEKNDYKTLVLMGIITGLAAAIKHTGLVVAVLLSTSILIFEIKKNRFSMLSFKRIVLFEMIILLILSPWLIKCFIHTGNIIETFNTINFIFGISSEQENLSIFDKIVKILIKPIRYILFDILFQRSISGTLWGIGSFILAFVPCLALIKGMDKTIKIILIYSISGLLLFSIISNNEVRMSVPIFASLSIVGAYAFYWLLSNFKSWSKFFQIIVLACCLFNIIPLAKYTLNALPVVIGSETKEHYLNRMTYIYNVVEYANNNLGDDVKILSMDLRGYFFDKPYVTIFTILDIIKSVPDITERLKKEKVTHLFCNENYSNTGYYPLPEDLRSHLKLIYSNNYTYLYKFDWYNNP